MLGGCNSLDLNPLSSGSSESWYSNETEVEMSLNRLFNIQFWESIQFDDGSYMHKDSWTDNWTERTTIQAPIAGTLNSQSPTVTNLWNTCYRCIAASNLLIEKLPNAYECTDGLPIDESPLYDPHNPFKNRDPRCTMTIQEFGKEMPGQGIIFQPHPDSL